LRHRAHATNSRRFANSFPIFSQHADRNKEIILVKLLVKLLLQLQLWQQSPFQARQV
jgi:hypothetical protein